MATITFRAQPIPVYNSDRTLAYRVISVPVLKRHHCDMAAFRKHPLYGMFANSDLFPNVLNKIRREILGTTLRLDQLPFGVTVDTSRGRLATVTAEV